MNNYKKIYLYIVVKLIQNRNFIRKNPKHQKHKNPTEISFSQKMTDISSVTNTQTFPCEHCPRFFKKRNKLARHVNETHLNLKDFQCPNCTKTFKRKSHLKRHMVTHSTDPKPFKCLYIDCLLRFSDKYHLERHIKVKHKNIKFECQACGLSFEKKLFLFKHNFQSHKQEKPFRCFHAQCAKSFYTKGTLAKHLKHHEFPFKKSKSSYKKKLENATEIKEETRGETKNSENEEGKNQIPTNFNLNDMNFIFEKFLDSHHEIPENNNLNLDLNVENSPEKIFLDEREEEKGMNLKEFIEKEVVPSKQQDGHDEKFEKEEIFVAGLLQSSWNSTEDQKHCFMESKKKDNEERIQLVANNGEKKKRKPRKKKLSEEGYVYACMEPNCGKTYSTVPFFSCF